MIVGNGDIARAIDDRLDVVFLASGLSNSLKVTFEDYLREKTMILNYKNNHVVYFSSLCIFSENTTYAAYKKEIEEVITRHCRSYTIYRLGNITWGDNPNTLLNYLKAHPNAERRNVIRFLINEKDFKEVLKFIVPGTKQTFNLTTNPVNVKDL